MALEPAAPTLNTSARSGSRRHVTPARVGLALGIPLFLMAMLDMLPAQPVMHWLGASNSLIVQWLLGTPVVLWCGWPFFVRAWVSWRRLQSLTCLP